MVLAAATLAGCGVEPGVYDLPVAEAYARLKDQKLEDFRFKRQCGILIHFRPNGMPDNRVEWRVTSGPRLLFTFTARLTPVSPTRTRVAIEMSPDPQGGEPYDGRKFHKRPAVIQPIRPAIERQIDLLLRGGTFEVDGLPEGDNDVCRIQRGRLEEGRPFHVDGEGDE